MPTMPKQSNGWFNASRWRPNTFYTLGLDRVDPKLPAKDLVRATIQRNAVWVGIPVKFMGEQQSLMIERIPIREQIGSGQRSAIKHSVPAIKSVHVPDQGDFAPSSVNDEWEAKVSVDDDD